MKRSINIWVKTFQNYQNWRYKMKNQTAEGLREKLFDTLDALIDKKITTKEAEAVCYVSEQIIKTANIELEMYREHQKSIEADRTFQLQLKKEEKKVAAQLAETISMIEVDEENV